jgi:hypothetical protein
LPWGIIIITTTIPIISINLTFRTNPGPEAAPPPGLGRILWL